MKPKWYEIFLEIKEYLYWLLIKKPHHFLPSQWMSLHSPAKDTKHLWKSLEVTISGAKKNISK